MKDHTRNTPALTSPQEFTHIGFTGSRFGMSPSQADEVYGIWRARTIYAYHHGGQRFALHHGDCVGADKEACEMARDLGWYVIGHPPKVTKLRAFFESDEERPPKDYLARDRDIVAESSELFATPKYERPRGGTWRTVEFAEAAEKPVYVVEPVPYRVVR